MFQYNNFYQLRDRLSNSACLINTTYGFSTRDSLLPTPNKTNGCLISSGKKVYAMCSADNLVIQNIEKQYITTKDITVTKKYLNSELHINTRNNENELIDRSSNDYNVEIILGNRKAFIYQNNVFIRDIKINGKAQKILNKDHHFYIITENSIYWINTFNQDNITFGVIFQPIQQSIIKSGGFIKNDKLYLVLVSQDKIYILKTPILEMTTDSSGNTVSTLNYTNVQQNNCINLPDNYTNFDIIDLSIIKLDNDNVKVITNNFYSDDVFIISVSTDKFTSFYRFIDNQIFYNDYIDKRTILYTVYNDQIFYKDFNSKKLYKTFHQFGNIDRNQESDNDIPPITVSFNNSLYIDFSSSREISIPNSSLPKEFDVCFSFPKVFGGLLVLDADIFGLAFFTFNSDLTLQGYIKPFPYYNSNKQIVTNTLYSYNNKNYLLNSMTGLMNFTFTSESNAVGKIDKFIDDNSLFIIPNSIVIKVQKYNGLKLDEQIFHTTQIWYDNIFGVFILPIHTDILKFVCPFPLESYQHIGYSLNNVALVYSKNHSFSPLITRVNALGENTLTSNYVIINNEIVYSRILDVGTVVATDINSAGSILFNLDNIPLGILVNKKHQLLVKSSALKLLLEKHINNNIFANINISYSKANENGDNKIIEMIQEGNRIKDILYFNYDNRKVSILTRDVLPFIPNIDGMIIEIFDNDNIFLGYAYLKISHDSSLQNNIPFEFQNNNFVYMSSLFDCFKSMEIDKQINNEEFFNSIANNRVKIKPTGFQFENNKVYAIGIDVSKLETSPLGLNLVAINDITEDIFIQIQEQSQFDNNLAYHDIEIARINGIEGFLVTEVSQNFIDKNSSIQLLGNILDKCILEDYYKHYLGDYLLKYYQLNKSSVNTLWKQLGTTICMVDYSVELENYSI